MVPRLMANGLFLLALPSLVVLSLLLALFFSGEMAGISL